MTCVECDAVVEAKRRQYPSLERSPALRGWTAAHPDGRGLVLGDVTLQWLHAYQHAPTTQETDPE